ncbi:spore germination protein GerW family protein [Psychrobacillus sp. FSL K6-1267]|uniref:spore germination protein GerW family protein n=1 Tax=Psychrobacillus sp. FSL K6-1267 TaxID=2921543 RepID=UPI0030FAE21D
MEEKSSNLEKQGGKLPLFQSPVRSIFEKFSREKDVSLIYGEPIVLENKRILPVAKVNYFVGGGGGGGNTISDEENSTGQGEGGGGAFSIKPVGIYEITAEEVKFKPVLPFNQILTVFSVVTLGIVFLLRKRCK